MTYGLVSGFEPSIGWQALKLGNGGLITHIDLASDGTMVGTTDSFGAYVWPPGSNAWVQLLNTSAISGLPQDCTGADDIKIDPSNSANIWLSYAGTFYKSTNRGTTFTALSGYTVAALNSANGSPAKVFGPYIAIDPNNGNIVYISTPAQGVQVTLDGGATWATLAATNGGLQPYSNTPALVVNTTSATSNSVGTGAKNFTTAGSISYNAGFSYVKVWQTSNPANNMYGLLSGSGTSYTVTVPTGSAFGSGSGITDWSFSSIMDTNNGGNCAGGHCIAFDKSASTISTGSGSYSGLLRTKNIYISTYGIGVFSSTDGGQTWTLLNSTGMPLAVKQMKVSSTGVVWTCDDMYGSQSNIGKYAAGAWTVNMNVNGQKWFTSFDVDPGNANRVVVVQADQPTIQVTLDAGATWPVLGAGSRAKRPVVSSGDVDWLADLYTNTDGFANCDTKFDPVVANKVWIGAEGVWYFTVPTVNNQNITFTQQSRGIEEFIGNNIMSLPGDSGAVLVSTWDIPVFKTKTLDTYPPHPGGVLGNTQTGLYRGYSFDYLWSDPSKVVTITQVGTVDTDHSGYSTNYGNNGSWTEFATKPNALGKGGHIAIFDTNSCVWVSDGTQLADGSNPVPKETADYTANPVVWTSIVIPGGTPLYGWQPNGPASTYSKSIESDKTNGDIYLFNTNTGATSSNPNGSALYKRTKATGAWSIVKSPVDFTGASNFNAKFRSIPGSYGLTGAMWFTGGHGGPPHPNAGRPLYYTTDGWTTSHVVANFTECAAVGFGASFPGHSGYPTIFVAGWLSSVYGVWMCKDFNTGTGAGTWTQCGGTYPLNIVGIVADLDGDKSLAGRVYVQTISSGAFYGTFS